MENLVNSFAGSALFCGAWPSQGKSYSGVTFQMLHGGPSSPHWFHKITPPEEQLL
jgi:hypothetical protein